MCAKTVNIFDISYLIFHISTILIFYVKMSFQKA